MTPQFTGRIVEWDRERGCGWVDSEVSESFCTGGSLRKRRQRPAAGDEIRLNPGTGPTGEICAKNAVHVKVAGGRGSGSSLRQAAGSFGTVALVLLVAVPIFPIAAIAKLRIHPAVAAVYALLVNSVVYLVYASDKKRAQEAAWRVPEIVLHCLELVGGWPGAVVAQRRLPNKGVKLTYQVTFGLSSPFTNASPSACFRVGNCPRRFQSAHPAEPIRAQLLNTAGRRAELDGLKPST